MTKPPDVMLLPVKLPVLGERTIWLQYVGSPVLAQLATRTGLPQRARTWERLNQSRSRTGRTPLLNHIEVLSPMLAHDLSRSRGDLITGRRRPRLHHVRGHLMRRGNQLLAHATPPWSRTIRSSAVPNRDLDIRSSRRSAS